MVMVQVQVLLQLFFLASRIIELSSSTNLIVSFYLLRSLLILAKVFFVFHIYFQFSFFLRYLLNSSCVCRASSIVISRFLILLIKATRSFNSLKSVSRLLLLTMVCILQSFYKYHPCHLIIK